MRDALQKAKLAAKLTKCSRKDPINEDDDSDPCSVRHLYSLLKRLIYNEE